MADKKITQLTNITGANLVDADEFVVVDISADETKAITLGELKEAFDSGSGFVRITGDTMTGDLALSGADVTFGDNDKAIFGGVTSELQIYSDGTHNYIEDTSTGNLYIQGTNLILKNQGGTENLADFVSNGAVTLYYDNSPKFATTSTGIDVTGEITADGLTIDTNANTLIGANNDAGASVIFKTNRSSANATMTNLDSQWNNTSVAQVRFETGSDTTNKDDGRIKFLTSPSSSGGVITRQLIENNGDISFYDSQGSSQSFFWDASAESLGIGTTTPLGDLSISDGGAQGLEINANTSGDTRLLVYNRSTNAEAPMQIRASEVDFNLGGSNRMVVSSTGIDVTGTVTADGLTVNGTAKINSTLPAFVFNETDTTNLNTRLAQSSGAFFVQNLNDAGTFTGTMMKVDNATGDISFYEDTGTTPKFFWDANAESLGIGATSVHADLHLGAASPHIDIGPSAGNRGKVGFDSNNVYIGSTSGTGEIHFKNNIGSTDAPHSSGDTKMVITDSGVGIGTSSPSALLQVEGSDGVAGGAIMYTASGVASGYMSADAAGLCLATDTAGITFRTGITGADPTDTGSERMRIDSSGHLLVGNTSFSNITGGSGGGVAIQGGGAGTVWASRNDLTGIFNRLSTDGDIVDFRKNGTTVGSIGTVSGGVSLGSGDTGLYFEPVSNEIRPFNTTTNASIDNAINLGNSTKRFKDLYLSGGVNIYNGATDAIDIRGTGSRCEIDNPANNAILLKTGGTTRVRIDANGLLFGSDTAAANALDDYEEGTWTPTLPNGGTISASRATYIKIGRLVHVQFQADITPTNNSSAFRIGGLPFITTSTSSSYSAGSLGYSGGLDVSGWNQPLVQHNGGDYLYFQVSTASTATVLNSNFAGSTRNFIISANYEANA